MEPSQYKNLLDQVAAINTRYKKINELTGENFNVFRILKLDSSEVRMHSAFIAELLNPAGSHGQKEVFLDLFVKYFCFKNNPIDLLSCKVKVEDYIGQISEDKTQGGRIDVIIRDKHNHQIVIENKIYARDQEHQLTRYYNNSSMADIIYLTLDGKPPSDNSKGEMIEGEHYKCASYKQDILNWLELCRKEVSIYPIVREALTHYINLIKHLTNQTLNHNMEEELSDIMKSYIEESFAITSNLNRACQKVSDDFGKLIIGHFEKIGMKCLYEIDFQERYSGIYIWRPEWKHLSIAFVFQYYDKDMFYGFLQEDPTKFEIPETLRSEIYSLPGNNPKSSDWWPWYKKLESPFNNWKELGAWQAILNGSMKEMIIEKTEYLLNLVKDKGL